MRRWMATLAILIGCGGWAQAQVAVPELVPMAAHIFDAGFPISPFGTLVPPNPAALQWGAPSRAGYAYLLGSKLDPVDGNSSSYDGSYSGLRWVQPRVGLAVDAIDIAAHFPNSGEQTKRHNAFALSFTWPDWLAWGISSTRLSTTFQGAVPPPDTTSASGWTAGTSMRLGEIVFVGLGYGKDDASLVGPFVGDAERTHTMAGVGLRGAGKLVWHLEYAVLNYGNYQDATGTDQLTGYDLALGTAEAIWGSWMLSASSHRATGALAGNVELSGYGLDFGYAPFAGLSVTYRYETTEKRNAGVVLGHDAFNTLAVSWGF